MLGEGILEIVLWRGYYDSLKDQLGLNISAMEGCI